MGRLVGSPTGVPGTITCRGTFASTARRRDARDDDPTATVVHVHVIDSTFRRHHAATCSQSFPIAHRPRS